jgi:hypothetical protein
MDADSTGPRFCPRCIEVHKGPMALDQHVAEPDDQNMTTDRSVVSCGPKSPVEWPGCSLEPPDPVARCTFLSVALCRGERAMSTDTLEE